MLINDTLTFQPHSATSTVKPLQLDNASHWVLLAVLHYSPGEDESGHRVATCHVRGIWYLADDSHVTVHGSSSVPGMFPSLAFYIRDTTASVDVHSRSAQLEAARALYGY